MKKLFVLFLFAFSANGAPLEEGEYCEKDGETGQCILLSQCQSASEDRQKGKDPKICGNRGSEVIVCCVPSSADRSVLTTAKSTSTTTEYIPTTADYQDVEGTGTRPDGCPPIASHLTTSRTGRKAWDKCLDYQEQLVFPCAESKALLGGLTRENRCHHTADQLIVGGINAEPNEFPHMVLLQYGDETQTSDSICGGSLISENFVLTAAHCTFNNLNVPVAHAVLGTLKQSDSTESRRYRIKNKIVHPQYNPPQKYNDIALLELEKNVTLDEFTVPACLHTGNKVNDSNALATGWGYLSQRGPVSDILQKVVLTKFLPLECTFKYKKNHNIPNGIMSKSQTCYGDRKGENERSKDTCQGDSGGPLQVKSEDMNCMYIIIGVTSIGNKCGLRDEPGLYTRVEHFLDWIEDIVWPN